MGGLTAVSDTKPCRVVVSLAPHRDGQAEPDPWIGVLQLHRMDLCGHLGIAEFWSTCDDHIARVGDHRTVRVYRWSLLFTALLEISRKNDRASG
jgi:hypothetical protein